MAKTERTGTTPRLRFPEFRGSEGWRELAIGRFIEESRERSTHLDQYEVLTSARSGLVRQRDYYENGSIPERDNVGFNVIPPNYLTYRSRSDDRRFYFNENKLGITGIISTFYPVFRIQGGNNEFFVNLFSRYVEFIGKYAVGTSQTVLSFNALRRIVLPVPSEDEQRVIADCLTSLDDVIAAQMRKVEALKAHKQGLMQQLFPREGETVPRLRFPEFRDAPEWMNKTLGDAAAFYNGKAYAKEELLESGKYRVLRVGNFFTSDRWYYSNLELEASKYCEDGDLLYAWSASFGPRIWRGGKTIYHYHIWKVAEKQGVSRSFLFAVLGLETERIRARSANGIGMFHITKRTIETWPSLFPTLEEQTKIADHVATISEALEVESKKLNGLRVHKAGLMQQLFPSPDAD